MSMVRCTLTINNGIGARIDRMTSTYDVPADSPRVFISYSHDSEDHKNTVIAFGTLLRTQLGIDAHLDEWYVNGRRDWSEWAIEQLESADYVLAIASPKFRERADGRSAGPAGRGAQFEGALMRNKVTQDRATWMRKILPVVLPGAKIADIPEFLLPYSATRYVIRRLTPDGIVELRRVLFQQPLHGFPPLGTPPPLSSEDVVSPRPQSGKPPKAGNHVRVTKSKARNIVGGDFNLHGERDDRRPATGE